MIDLRSCLGGVCWVAGGVVGFGELGVEAVGGAGCGLGAGGWALGAWGFDLWGWLWYNSYSQLKMN